MAEQAYAYVTLIPVAKGFQGAIAKEMAGVSNVGKQAGEGAGSRFTQGFGSVMKGLAVAGAAAVGVAAAGIGVAMNKGFARLQNIENARNLLQGIGHDAESVEVIMGNALESVLGTAFGLDEAAKVAASAVAAGIEPGEALERQLKIIGDTAVVAGTSMEDIGSIMGKVTTSNRATNRELQQLAERGIPVYQMLADEAGVAADEVFAMASRGEISAEMLANALESNLGGAALKAGETTQGAFANMNASIARVGANLIGPVFDQLAGFFGGLTDALKPVEAIAADLGVTLGTALEPVFASIIDLVPKLVDAIVPLLPTLIDLGVAILDMVIGALPLLIDFIGALVPVFEALLPSITDLVPVILELAQSLLPVFVDVISALVPVIAELAPIIVELITTGLAILLPIFLALAQAIMPLVEALLPVFADLFEALAPVVLELLDALGPLIEASLPIFIQMVELLTPVLVFLANILSGILVAAVTVVIDIVGQVINWFTNFATSASTLWSNLQTAFQNIMNFFRRFWDNTRKAFSEGIDRIIQFFRDLPGNVLRVLVGAGQWLLQTGRDILQGMRNGIDAIWANLTSWFRDIPNMIRNLLSGASSWLTNIGRQVIDGFLTGLKNAWEAVTGWISGAASAVSGAFKSILGIKSPSRVFMEFGEAIGEGLVLGMQKMQPEIESQVGMMIAVPNVERAIDRDGPSRTMNYYAAPNQSLSGEQELMKAMRRARLVANW